MEPVDGGRATEAPLLAEELLAVEEYLRIKLHLRVVVEVIAWFFQSHAPQNKTQTQITFANTLAIQLGSFLTRYNLKCCIYSSLHSATRLVICAEVPCIQLITSSW